MQVKSNVQMIKEMCKCKKCTDDKFNLPDDDHDDKMCFDKQMLPDMKSLLTFHKRMSFFLSKW